MVPSVTPRPATITVVVMGYRNRATIVDAVASVVTQTAPEPAEVVVVTSGDDGSADTVRAAYPDLRVVDAPTRLLPGGARNVGMDAATGTVVAFLAADCLAEPGWVAARAAAHRAGHPVVAGAMTLAPPRRLSAWALHFDLYGARLPGRGVGPVLPGDPAAHGLSFDRAVLDRVGPFDTALPIGEDTDFARRLAALDVPVWFDPRVRTAHRGPATTRALLAERYQRGQAAARLAPPDYVPPRRGRVLIGFPRHWSRRMAHTVATGWRNGRPERLRLVAALPWIALGIGAGLAGRYRQRFRPSPAVKGNAGSATG